MTEKPLVTVVTVCYNCREQLLVTMQSVGQQDYEAVEYIVIDGASTDGTADWLAHYTGRLSRWVSEPDKGIYDAMNKAVAMATGSWVIFMNAGDTFAAPDVLSRVFATPRQSDVIYGDVVKHGVVKVAEEPHNAHRMFFCHQSALVRMACLREFPFDVSHRYSADFKQMKQLFLAGRSFLQLHFPIACFDTTGVSNTRRSAALWDNICVVRQVDGLADQLRLLPRLYFTWLWCRLRGR